MNAEKKVRMKRVGRWWIDRAILDEGYELTDFVDTDNVVLELPELFDPDKRRNVGWMLCPDCGELEQIDRREPMCSRCGWKQETELEQWAA